MKKAGCLLDIRNDSIIWPDKLASTPKLEVSRRLTEVAAYTIPFTLKSTLSPIKPSIIYILKALPKLLHRPTPEKEDAPFNIYSIRVYAFRLLAKRAKQDSTHVFATSIKEIDNKLALYRNL